METPAEYQRRRNRMKTEGTWEDRPKITKDTTPANEYQRRRNRMITEGTWKAEKQRNKDTRERKRTSHHEWNQLLAHNNLYHTFLDGSIVHYGPDGILPGHTFDFDFDVDLDKAHQQAGYEKWCDDMGIDLTS